MTVFINTIRMIAMKKKKTVLYEDCIQGIKQ